MEGVCKGELAIAEAALDVAQSALNVRILDILPLTILINLLY
jgi:hypothetical protein